METSVSIRQILWRIWSIVRVCCWMIWRRTMKLVRKAWSWFVFPKALTCGMRIFLVRLIRRLCPYWPSVVRMKSRPWKAVLPVIPRRWNCTTGNSCPIWERTNGFLADVRNTKASMSVVYWRCADFWISRNSTGMWSRFVSVRSAFVLIRRTSITFC